MVDIFTQIGQHAAQQATVLLAQETFGMVETMSLLRVDETVDGEDAYYTLRWQALSMGIVLCDVAMVLLPEFLDSDDTEHTELTETATSYLVENTVIKLRQASEEDE